MLSRLRQWLGGAPQPLPDDRSPVLEALAARVAALEAEREELLLAWAATREQWVRTLKRMGGLKGGRGRPAEEAQFPELDESLEEEDLVTRTLRFGRG